MNIKYLLQQYDDGTFGYLDIDGDKFENKTTGAKVILQQEYNEDRNDFIEKNNIVFNQNQYGSNALKDFTIIEGTLEEKLKLLDEKYGLEKLLKDNDIIKANDIKNSHIELNKILPPIINILEKLAKNSIYAIDVKYNPSSSYSGGRGLRQTHDYDYSWKYFFDANFNYDGVHIRFDGTLVHEWDLAGDHYDSNNTYKVIKYNDILLNIKKILEANNVDTIYYIANEKASNITYTIKYNRIEIEGPKDISSKISNNSTNNDHAYDPKYWGWT